MGITDTLWINDKQFATSSSDNKVHVWNLADGIPSAPEYTLLQTAEEQKKATPERQVLGLSHAPNGDLSGVNLRGDIFTWKTSGDKSFTALTRSQDVIKDMVVYKNWLIHSCGNRLFATEMAEVNHPTVEIQNCSQEQAIDAFCVTDNSVYAGGCCKILTRLNPVGGSAGFEEAAKCTLPGHAYSLSGDDEKMFALVHTGQVV